MSFQSFDTEYHSPDGSDKSSEPDLDITGDQLRAALPGLEATTADTMGGAEAPDDTGVASMGTKTASAKVYLVERASSTLTYAQAKAKRLGGTAKNVAQTRKFQATTAGAAGGAAAIGATGGAAGLATGTTVGLLAGLLFAPFTFGLSIPIFAVLGGSSGLMVGAAVGGTIGALGGGAAGHCVYSKRARIIKEIISARAFVENTMLEVSKYTLTRMHSTNAAAAKKYQLCIRECSRNIRRAATVAKGTLTYSQNKAEELGSTVKAVAQDPTVRATTVGAAVGSAALGAAGGTAGLATGTTMGAITGLLLAPFTLGLSIPISTVIGAGSGLVIGAAAGGATGALSGGAAGYGAYSKRSELMEGTEFVKGKVGEGAIFVKGNVELCRGYVKGKVSDVRTRLGSGTGGSEGAAHADDRLWLQFS